MNRLFSQLLVGACFAALAWASTAQTFSGGDLQEVADTKSMPTQAGGDTTPPPAPPGATGASSSKAHAKHSASSKHAQHHAHTKTASHKKSTSHVTKSPDKVNASTAPAAREDNAYRQALRGCATEQNQAQRDSCLDSAIERFQPNT